MREDRERGLHRCLPPNGSVRPVAAIVLVLVLVLLLVVAAEPTQASRNVERWTGEVELEQTYRVAPGQRLHVGPGTRILPADPPGGGNATAPLPSLRVEGELVVDANASAPARFTVPVTISSNATDPSLIANATFQLAEQGSSCALSIDQAPVDIRSSSFEGNDRGLCVRVREGARDAPVIRVRGSWFQSNRIGMQLTLVGTDASDAAAGPLIVTRGNTFTHHVDQEATPTAEGAFPRSQAVGLIVRAEGSLKESHPAPRYSDGEISTVSSGALFVSEGDTFADNTLAVRIDPGVRGALFRGSRIVDNAVGIRATETSEASDDGQRALLEHAVLDNQARDIYFEGTPYAVSWTGTQLEPSCVYSAKRSNVACVEGAVGRLGLVATLLGLTATLVALLTEVGAYTLWRLLFALRLFSRIDDEELLEHEVRAKLLELVREEPGRHLRSLARSANGYGSTVHHLRRLEEAGYVRSERDGIYRRFYPEGDLGPDVSTRASTRSRILDEIEAEPGVHASAIARRLEISKQLVSYHVTALVEAGRVDRETGGWKARLWPIEPERGTSEDG